jgi:ribosomal protein L3 glutamine methyltransferase
MARNPFDQAARIRRVGELLDWATCELEKAPLRYGHGTAGPRDDAAALVFHALRLRHDSAPASYRRVVPAGGAMRAAALVRRRIVERVPSAYLTGVTWFAGHEIRVTPDVWCPFAIGNFACVPEPGWPAPPACSISPFGIATGGTRCRARGSMPPWSERRPAGGNAAASSGAHMSVATIVYGALRGRRYDIIVSNPPLFRRR